MKAGSLKLYNYRNYQQLDLRFSPGINIFLGQNAQGKTNIVEALYYAAMGHSHRTHNDGELIHWEQEAALVDFSFSRLEVENNLKIKLQKGKRRQLVLNGGKLTLKELIGSFNVVLFSPEDLFLVKGAPAERRRFLNTEISQASPAYYAELRRYTRLLQQRNTLLKRIRERKASSEMLDMWDEQLADSAAKIVKRRLEAVKKLKMLANLMQRRISDNRENLQLSYEFAAGKSENMTENLVSWYNNALKECREFDIFRGVTSVGPQRDDLEFTVNGKSLKSYGSQGQQRTSALALKLSELEFLRSETGEYPVLLLDDVMSELDETRRRQLLAFVRRENIQTIITATDAAYFPHDEKACYYQVQAGRITMR